MVKRVRVPNKVLVIKRSAKEAQFCYGEILEAFKDSQCDMVFNRSHFEVSNFLVHYVVDWVGPNNQNLHTVMSYRRHFDEIWSYRLKGSENFEKYALMLPLKTNGKLIHFE